MHQSLGFYPGPALTGASRATSTVLRGHQSYISSVQKNHVVLGVHRLNCSRHALPLSLLLESILMFLQDFSLRKPPLRGWLSPSRNAKDPFISCIKIFFAFLGSGDKGYQKG